MNSLPLFLQAWLLLCSYCFTSIDRRLTNKMRKRGLPRTPPFLGLAVLWKGSYMARNPNSQRKERRFEDLLIVIERRNGKALLYGQVILFLSLLVTLLWLLIA
jgi:hypothetical protein